MNSIEGLTDCTIEEFICCEQRTEHAPDILVRFAGLVDNEVIDQPEKISVEKVDETLQTIKFGFSEVCIP